MKVDKATIRWGIIGCGGIAHVFAKGLQKINGGTLYAVASNSEERAQRFADSYQVEQTYSNYVSLVEDPNIDAVYIATTHNFHFENIKLCLSHGKHVLCEKPLTINARQCEAVIELATQKSLFVMEAVWTRFLPAIRKLDELLNKNIIGDVVSVKADFSIAGEFESTHRLKDLSLAGGALLDLGIYPITFASLVFKEQPARVQSTAVMGETGVDEHSAYLFDYDNGKTALLSSSFIYHAPTEAVISGTKGYIRIPEFLAAQTLHLHIEGQPESTISLPFTEEENFTFEIEHAQACIQSGLTQSDILPLSTTLSIMQTMDKLRSQWDLVYPDE